MDSIILFVCLNVMCAVSCTENGIDGLIVGGEDAVIEQFPHSVYLAIMCITHIKTVNYACGGSVVNQAVVLMAAHCIPACQDSLSILASAGSANRLRGFMSTVTNIIIHPHYDEVLVNHDIALMKLKTPLTFGLNISRVVIVEDPPQGTAYVAGWGLVNEDPMEFSKWLHYLKQPLIKRHKCEKILENQICNGCICAGEVDSKRYAASGDSGSALVVNKYIQIGIVSHRIPEWSKSITVYTDVAYHYKWIENNTQNLFCFE